MPCTSANATSRIVLMMPTRPPGMRLVQMLVTTVNAAMSQTRIHTQRDAGRTPASSRIVACFHRHSRRGGRRTFADPQRRPALARKRRFDLLVRLETQKTLPLGRRCDERCLLVDSGVSLLKHRLGAFALAKPAE